MFPETIETDSLALGRVSEETVDVFELYELYRQGAASTTGVFEYVPQDPYETVKDARDQITDAQEAWEERSAAPYAVFVTDVNDDEESLAGISGLALEWERRTGTLGLILARPYWGNGYAGECAMALTELAFDRLDLDVVAIGYEHGNDRSKSAVESFVDRVDGRYEGRLRNWTPIDDEILDHHRYTVTQAEYEEG